MIGPSPFLIFAQCHWGTSSKHQVYAALNQLTCITEIIMTAVCCFNNTKITHHVPYIHSHAHSESSSDAKIEYRRIAQRPTKIVQISKCKRTLTTKINQCNEEIELQKKAEPTDVRLKPSKSGNTDTTNYSTSKNQANWKAKCCLVIVLFLLAIAIIAAIALSVYALVSSNQGMDTHSLMLHFQELKMQLNETKEASEKEIAQLKRDLTRIQTEGFMLQNSVDTAKLNSLQSSVSSLNTTNEATMTQLNSLQSSVSSLNTANGETTTQLNSLQSSVNSLNTANGATTTQLNSLQSSVNSLNTANGATTTQLNSLQSSVSSLTTRVNSPVNLYQNCIQEITNCTIGPRTTADTYWTECYTAFGPISSKFSLQLGVYVCIKYTFINVIMTMQPNKWTCVSEHCNTNK